MLMCLMRRFTWSGLSFIISNQVDQDSLACSLTVLRTQNTLPPVSRTAAARRLTVGTISTATGT